MKKIMFNDRYALTQAVLDGRKTQTRRVIPKSTWAKVGEFMVDYYNQTFDSLTVQEALEQYFFLEKIGKLPYNVGEVVAVAQSYKDAGFHPDTQMEQKIRGSKTGGVMHLPIRYVGGWTNKLFVRADLLPHRVRITDVRVERLNDISEVDIKFEGIDGVVGYRGGYYLEYGIKTDKGWLKLGNTSREAYAALIDKISGKGTFQSNPYVFAYTFELVK